MSEAAVANQAPWALRVLRRFVVVMVCVALGFVLAAALSGVLGEWTPVVAYYLSPVLVAVAVGVDASRRGLRVAWLWVAVLVLGIAVSAVSVGADEVGSLAIALAVFVVPACVATGLVGAVVHRSRGLAENAVGGD